MTRADRRLRALLLCALTLPAHAWAQDPGCVPFGPSGFHDVVVAAHDALLSGDVLAHQALLRDLRVRVACLDAAVSSTDLAQLLYELAMVRYADGQAWQDTVTAALRADPTFARTYGPPEIRAYPVPVPTPAHRRPELPGARLWIDGRPAPDRFDLIGPHLLQIERAGVWSSVWVDDGVLPPSWQPAPAAVEAPAPVDPPPVQAPPPVAPAEPVAPSPAEPSLALRVVVGAGLAVAAGPPVLVGEAQEPSARLWAPVEAGVQLDAGRGWVRVLGSVLPMLNGQHVFTVDGALRTSRVGGGASVSGGGAIGPVRVGALVGVRLPSRVVTQALGAVELHRAGLGLELRAGVDLTTASTVEPAFDLLLVFAPRVWSRP